MSRVAELVAQLISAGTPADVAATVVAEAFAAGAASIASGMSGGIPVDKAAEKRRAYDRERKREKRTSGGIPVECPRNSETALSSSTSTKSVVEKKRKKERARGSQIPPDWQPNETHFRESQKLGIGWPQVEGMAEDMRLWARANGHRDVARKSDWDATFLGWMRRNSGNGTSGKQHGTSENSLVAAGRRRIEELDAIIAGGGSGERPESAAGLFSGNPNVRLLPARGGG